MNNLFDLSGKKAIVTGAAGGLGRGMAEGLHMAGAEIVLMDAATTTSAVAKEIGKSGPSVSAVQVDLGDRDTLQRGFEQAVDRLGGLDILVNSHGIQRRHPSVEFPVEDWDAVLNINLKSVFLLCQLAGQKMLPLKYGKIINIASLLSFSGGLTVPAYAASKGGVAQLTKALANEWASEGVNVNAIAPGYMDTALNTALINDPTRSSQILARIPAARWGKPSDLQGTVIWLASDASSYVHGIIVPVDGGWMSR